MLDRKEGFSERERENVNCTRSFVWNSSLRVKYLDPEVEFCRLNLAERVDRFREKRKKFKFFNSSSFKSCVIIVLYIDTVVRI